MPMPGGSRKLYLRAMIQRTIRLYKNAYQGLSPSVWLLAGVMLINRCGTMVLPFMSIYLTHRLHFSVTNTGIIMAIFGIGAFVGTYLGGRLTDRFGFYYVQLISLLVSGAALITLQFITDFYLLCGSVFVFALLSDTFRPANQSAIAHYSTPETRTRAFSCNRLAINLGWAVGGGLGGWLASIDYSFLFWADGLTCLTAGIVLWINLPVPVVAGNATLSLQTQSTGSDSRMLSNTSASPYRDGLFIAFVVCAALYFVAFMQFFSIVPLYFSDALHLSVSLIGVLMTINGLLIVGIEMALVYGIEQRKWPKMPLIITGILLTVVSYVVLIAPTGTPSGMTVFNLGIGLVFVLFITAGEMLTLPFLQTFTVERSSPATRGQYLALYAMGGALAQTIAPAFGSQMVAHFGFPAHWLTIAGISVVSAGGFWWVGRRLGNVATIPRKATAYTG